MASDDRKAKGTTAPKTDAPQQSKSTPDAAPSNPKTDAPQQGKSTPNATPSKSEGGEKDAAVPTGYSRGEGQKPVSKAYKENWNLIFGKGKKRNPRRADRHGENAIALRPDGHGSFTFSFVSPRGEMSGRVNVGTEGSPDRRSDADKEQAARNQVLELARELAGACDDKSS